MPKYQSDLGLSARIEGLSDRVNDLCHRVDRLAVCLDALVYVVGEVIAYERAETQWVSKTPLDEEQRLLHRIRTSVPGVVSGAAGTVERMLDGVRQEAEEERKGLVDMAQKRGQDRKRGVKL